MFQERIITDFSVKTANNTECELFISGDVEKFINAYKCKIIMAGNADT